MSSSIASTAATQLVRRAIRGITHSAAVTIAAAAINTATPHVLEAQVAPEQNRWEFMVNSGKLLPTGVQRDALQRGNMTAAQIFYVVHPAVAVTATAGWARSRDIAATDDPKLDVFTYDVGAEVRAPEHAIGGNFTFRPMLGIGAGARSYNYRSLDVDAAHNLAAYGSATAELGYRRVRLRIEARDYVTGFKPLAGNGASATRNDVAVTVGLRVLAR